MSKEPLILRILVVGSPLALKCRRQWTCLAMAPLDFLFTFA